MALSAGTRLGPYEILAPLGAGGMGEVYRAKDPRLGREVAIKVLPEEVADDPDLLHRFAKEAKAAGALNHPNILVVYDTGTHEDAPYVVTELLEGDTLRERMGGAALPVRKAVEYGVQIARGLAAAHGKGIVHRDVKPENLFVTKDGLVKILDFGLAKVLQPRLLFKEGEDTPSRGPTTEPGRIMGTVDYMSPEQVRARSVDHLSDLFSFGTVLYEMLSGHRPFRGETLADTMTAILTKDPLEPSARDRSIPKALDRIVSRCLEKLPEDRYQSARDLAFDLEAVSEATGAPRGRHRWTLAGAVVVAALALTVAYLRPWPEARPSSEAQPALSESTRDRKMLVVLPFENLGPPEDAYFAAGITEEITSRLARVSGLGVTSRTTATQYDRAGKTMKKIGEDLQVGFVLEGTVRWDRQAEGAGRVRVTPQLIRVADDTHLWADSYDRLLDDIFAVQSEIAGAVVGQLGVALLPDEQRAIAARPTESLEAYQAYLRGLEYYWDPDFAEESYELAVRMFERAVGHDPAFVAAHGFLSEAHSALYWFWYDRSPGRLDAAREAALRALELDPDSPEGHRALGSYHYYGHRDYQQALEEYRLAAKRLPNDSWIAARIGWVRRRQGRFDGAIAGLEKALELDPPNAQLASELANTYRFVRQYPEADRYNDLSISLAPNQLVAYARQALIALSWNGALERARTAVEGAPRNDQPVYFGARVTLELYQRTYQAALDHLAAGPAIIGETGEELHPRELLEGDAYRLMGRADEARAAYQAARDVLEKLVEERPEDHRVRSSLGRAYAGLGRKAEAVRDAQAAVKLLPVSRDAYDGVRAVWALAAVYTLVGEHDAAIDQLEYLLSIPSPWSAWDLRLDPRWDPLRDHPRFKKLVGEDWQAEASP